MVVLGENFAFHGLEGGFNVGVGGIFDGFCGTQNCAFQIACASVPARISLAENLPPIQSVPRDGKGSPRNEVCGQRAFYIMVRGLAKTVKPERSKRHTFQAKISNPKHRNQRKQAFWREQGHSCS
jgi:hypothetical protein